jgi:hypothetical protein
VNVRVSRIAEILPGHLKKYHLNYLSTLRFSVTKPVGNEGLKDLKPELKNSNGFLGVLRDFAVKFVAVLRRV